jgi:flagellar biosynthetic protein FliR
MSPEQWSAYFLLFARFSALVAVMPVFAWQGVPVLSRIGFSALLAFLLFSATGREAELLSTHFLLVVLAAAGEALFGLALGFLVILTFTAVRIAGQLLDLQSGLLMSAVLDPQYGGQETAFGQFYHLFAIVLFLTLDAHHLLLAALARSVELVPPGSVGMNPAALPTFFALFSQMFIIAFQLAAPVLIVLILTDIALGLISKTVPQLQVFVEGMPLKVGIALLILYLTFPYFSQALEKLFYRLAGDVFLLFHLFRAPAG